VLYPTELRGQMCDYNYLAKNAQYVLLINIGASGHYVGNSPANPSLAPADCVFNNSAQKRDRPVRERYGAM
jgi:hypothetical protein